MFPIRIIAPLEGQYLSIMLAALTAINVDWLRRNPLAPPLYLSGVRYQTEPKEDWLSIPEVWRRGSGDCEDLATWRAAELIVSGEPAIAYWEQPVVGRRLYHILVRRNDNTIEDPSRVLGMRG